MENNVFKNVITDLKLKEHFGDEAISLLANQKLIELPKDLKHLVVEFAYLLMNNSEQPITMFKVVTPKRLFKQSKTYYFGTQDNKLLLLNENFNEETFRKIQNDMFVMHQIDVININRNDYRMELY